MRLISFAVDETFFLADSILYFSALQRFIGFDSAVVENIGVRHFDELLDQIIDSYIQSRLPLLLWATLFVRRGGDLARCNQSRRIRHGKNLINRKVICFDQYGYKNEKSIDGDFTIQLGFFK